MSIRSALAELDEQVNRVKLAPAQEIRARGNARRTRHMAMVAVGVVAVTAAGAVALSPLGPASVPGGSSPAPSGSADPSCVADGVSWVDTSAPSAPSHHARIFIRIDASPEQRDVVAHALSELPYLRENSFNSREDAYQRFVRDFCHAPELVNLTKPDSLPESFDVSFADPSDYDRLVDDLGGLPGVDVLIHVHD
jgi:hypothetical protein